MNKQDDKNATDYGYRDDLSASLENYMETIYAVILKQSAVRVKDIARHLKVKNSSVTSALKMLAGKELINYEPYGVITFTKEGAKVARRVYEKHKIVEGFLIKVLGVNPGEAGDWACRIEHVISPDILKRLLTLIKFIYESPEAGEKWINSFKLYCDKEMSDLKCDDCFDRCYQYYINIDFKES